MPKPESPVGPTGPDQKSSPTLADPTVLELLEINNGLSPQGIVTGTKADISFMEAQQLNYINDLKAKLKGWETARIDEIYAWHQQQTAETALVSDQPTAAIKLDQQAVPTSPDTTVKDFIEFYAQKSHNDILVEVTKEIISLVALQEVNIKKLEADLEQWRDAKIAEIDAWNEQQTAETDAWNEQQTAETDSEADLPQSVN